MSTIKIGKNAIENLTIGMYNDSKVIYREYIQNAADSIDLACRNRIYNGDERPQIEIEVNDKERVVRIRDNGYGVKASDIKRKLANVADSDKERGVDKGFRGIGRLGGLAYCETLRFITTYPGEDIKTIMTWDAKELVRMINDPTIKESAEEVLGRIISYSTEKCDAEMHYFIVELEHIKKENNELLDFGAVKRYVSSNVPVDYNSKFYLKSDIKSYVSKKNLTLSEYQIFVEGEDVFKQYSHVLYEKSEILKPYDEIESLEFHEFRNNRDELLAWMWFGISAFNKQIPPYPYNDMRGIRLRKDNIQIGDEYTLSHLFKEMRGNTYFIGELHALHKDLIPNARRDYFNENPTRLEFEKEVRDYFKSTLHLLYTDANKAKNAYKKEVQLQQAHAKYEEKQKIGFTCEDEKEELESKIDSATKEHEQSQKEIEKLKQKASANPIFSKVMESIEKKHKNSSDSKPVEDKASIKKKEKSDESSKKTPLLTDNLTHLSESERRLIGKIYKVINSVLPPAQSVNIIQKIQDELNKK